MDAEAILTKARQEESRPEGWILFPLQQKKVLAGLVGWTFGVIMGLGMFAAIASVVIPANYERGALPAIITTLILCILLFIGLGSAWTFYIDVLRLQHADEHLIVITPEDFVMQEGKKILHVPLVEIRHITARGVPPPERAKPTRDGVREVASVGDNATAFFVGRNLSNSGRRWMRNRKRTPTSLAFVDSRTDSEVTVLQDKAYGDPFLIAAYLKQYTAAQS